MQQKAWHMLAVETQRSNDASFRRDDVRASETKELLALLHRQQDLQEASGRRADVLVETVRNLSGCVKKFDFKMEVDASSQNSTTKDAGRSTGSANEAPNSQSSARKPAARRCAGKKPGGDACKLPPRRNMRCCAAHKSQEAHVTET